MGGMEDLPPHVGEAGARSASDERAAGASCSICPPPAVLFLLRCGATRSEVADRLSIGRNTVDSHRRRMVGKLGLKRFQELVHVALDIDS
jgi:hypothetical protein